MADPYVPGLIQTEYDAEQIQFELEKIAAALAELSTPIIIMIPQANEPARRTEGMVAFADGTNWNPTAGGAGLYEYRGGAWNKL